MCKRTGLLYMLLMVLAVVVQIKALPVSSVFLDSDESDYDDSFEDDYDVVFDQRQNGTANVRVSVDGVLLALPGPEVSPSASLAGATLLDLFASQLASGGESEDNDSNELYSGTSQVSSSGTSTSSTTTTTTPTTSTTTAKPAAYASPAIGGISNDFALESLPVSLFGQGLNLLFNTRPGEIPFRVNPEADPSKKPIPFLITKVEKAPVRVHHDRDAQEQTPEVADVQRTPLEHSGRKKRKHKRKYSKVRLANILRPLLKRTLVPQ